MNKYVNPLYKNSIATSSNIQNNELNRRRKKMRRKSPFADEVAEEGERRRWRWGVVCGRGWRRTKRWGRRVWGFYFRECSLACQSALRNCLEGVFSSTELPLCRSSFLISVRFFYGNNIVAIHVFHKLVFSARLNTKMLSWAYCVLVFDSSGEPAARPADAFAVVLGGSESEFEVGRAKSCHDVPSLEKRSSMGCASKFWHCLVLFWLCSGHLSIFGISEELVKLLWFRRVVITSRLKLRHEASVDADVPLWHDVWSLSLVALQCLLPVAATNAFESYWKRPSTMVCIISDVDILWCSMIAPHSLRLLSQIISVTILLQRQLMQQGISSWSCAGQSAPKKGHNLWSHWWTVSSVAVPSTFDPRCVFIVRLIVDRIRWHFRLCAAHGTELITCCAPHIWDNLHQWRWNGRVWAPEKQSVQRRRIRWRRCGSGWAEPLLCDCANGSIREAQSFLLPHLQEGCVCHEPRSTRDLAPLPGDEALSTGSAFSFRDSGLAGAWFRRQRHERGKSECQRERILRAPQVVRERE